VVCKNALLNPRPWSDRKAKGEGGKGLGRRGTETAERGKSKRDQKEVPTPLFKQILFSLHLLAKKEGRAYKMRSEPAFQGRGSNGLRRPALLKWPPLKGKKHPPRESLTFKEDPVFLPKVTC